MIDCAQDARLRASDDVRSLCAARFVLDCLGRGMCVLIPLLSYLGLSAPESLQLNLAAWCQGGLHTLWTGHVLHFTLEHFLWDAFIFLMLSLLLWREERWQLWAWIFLSAPIISIAVFYVDPQLNEYRGLSALDSLLFARFGWGLWHLLKGWPRVLFGLLPLIGFFAKILFELMTGTSYFVSDLGEGVVALPSAHMAGFLLGSLWAGSSYLARGSLLRKALFIKTPR